LEKDDSPEVRAMTPLHPNQIWLLRIRWLITAASFLPIIALFDYWSSADVGPLRWTELSPGFVTAFGLLLAIFVILFLPPRRYRAWAYREEEDELHIRHGLLMRVQTVVPFGRVQHIDTTQGPIERRLGLATLILHTAGTRSAAVSLPGLREADAEQMRDRIRAKIRQDLV
jgi:hypothetical protein